MTRRGLGRGLDALLATEGEGHASATLVPHGAIQPNPYQPRQAMDEEGLGELAASIKAHGLIQPLVVASEGEGYVLIAGERRWRAAKLAGLAEVPVVVRQASPRDMLAVALIENVQRTNLDPIEAATAYKRLSDEFGLTQEDVASVVGKSRAAVANAVRLLQLEPEVTDLVHAGRLSEGHARALLTMSAGHARVVLARRAASEGLSVRAVEQAARPPRPEEAAPRKVEAVPSGDPHDTAAVRALESALGTRVELRRKGQGGALVVHFYSGEELQALYERLTST